MTASVSGGRIVPDGYGVIATGVDEAGAVFVKVRPKVAAAVCPSCSVGSRSVHSRYRRTISDLPMAGRRLRLEVEARRFRCRQAGCRYRVFCERLPSSPPWARRTARLETLVRQLALVLGGRPAERMAKRLMTPVSDDTLLRSVRRAGRPEAPPAEFVGVDDWAWRRNYRYGTIVCDLERRSAVCLLPDREPATVAAWFKGQPQISIVARDRAGGYALASSRGAPQALQVADRWHLMENASAAFLGVVRGAMREVRAAIGSAVVDPTLLTSAERLRYEGWTRRDGAREAVVALAAEGASIKEIVRRTGHSRGLVRVALRGRPCEVFMTRQSSIERWLVELDARWAEGERNGAALWRALRAQGFQGSLRVVTEWATRRRKADKTGTLTRTPSARMLARMLTTGRDRLTEPETVTVAAIERDVPALVRSRGEIEVFHEMVRRQSPHRLDEWLDAAADGPLARFVNGLRQDIATVRAALAGPWSNGQTEGRINKLKLIRRQMYGRGKLDLLEARLIGAS